MGEAEELFAEILQEEPTYHIQLFSLNEVDGEKQMEGEVSIRAHHLENMPWDYDTAYVQVTELTEEDFETYLFKPSKQQVIDDTKRLIEHVEWGEYTKTSEGGYEVEVNLGPAKWEAKLPTETLTPDHPVSELLDRYYGSQK